VTKLEIPVQQKSKMPEKRVPSSETLRRVALVRTEVSKELSASFIRVTRIGKLGTTLAVTSNRHSLRWRRYDPSKRQQIQEPQGETSQKTAFFILIDVKTSNLTFSISV
jgi:hypothetical protein